jgi:pimeloyl-ACP methyl ester carboxylesterase
MIEEPLQFGEGGRLFGILTVPEGPSHNASDKPVFVFLSSGLLHRIGPRRLYVRLARELAELGFSSLRVDLAGRGDSSPSPGLSDEQSTVEDYEEIVSALESRLGPVRLILGGLCSAADDALRLAPANPRVVGLLLLDPVCERDRGFRLREIIRKYTTPAQYGLSFKRRFMPQSKTDQGTTDPEIDRLAIRNYPRAESMREAFDAIRERRGRVLSVFTSYATDYLNQAGQLGRVMQVKGYQKFCTELFWPGAEHSFTLELHRARLVEEVRTWVNAWPDRRVAPARTSRAPFRVRAGASPAVMNRRAAHEQQATRTPVHNHFVTPGGSHH